MQVEEAAAESYILPEPGGALIVLTARVGSVNFSFIIYPLDASF